MPKRQLNASNIRTPLLRYHDSRKVSFLETLRFLYRSFSQREKLTARSEKMDSKEKDRRATWEHLEQQGGTRQCRWCGDERVAAAAWHTARTRRFIATTRLNHMTGAAPWWQHHHFSMAAQSTIRHQYGMSQWVYNWVFIKAGRII